MTELNAGCKLSASGRRSIEERYSKSRGHGTKIPMVAGSQDADAAPFATRFGAIRNGILDGNTRLTSHTSNRPRNIILQ